MAVFKEETALGLAKAAAVFATASITASSAIAQDVVSLTISRSGSVVQGELLSFDGETYLLRTNLGDLNIPADQVVCDGSACPARVEAVSAEPHVETPIVSTELVDGASIIRISGSSAIADSFLPGLLQRFAASQGEEIGVFHWQDSEMTSYQMALGGSTVQYEVAPQTVALSLMGMASGDQDITLAYRQISDREATRLDRRGLPDLRTAEQQLVLGNEPFVLIADPALNISSLTMQQIRDVFNGRYFSWDELGGAPVPIMVISREAGVEARQVSDLNLRGDSANIQGIQTTFVGSSEQAIDMFAIHPGGVGFVSASHVGDFTEIQIIDDCGAPLVRNDFAIRSEDYPLAGRVYLYMRQDTASPEAAAFWEFATGGNALGQLRAEQTGLYDATVIARPHADDALRVTTLNERINSAQSEAAAQMLIDLASTSGRLSTTFRFAAETGALDERSDQSMARLIAFLEGNSDISQIVFAGFSHDGDPTNAQSAQFAQQVEAAFAERAGDRLQGIDIGSAGYGNLAPVACNDADVGRRMNERVEVWFR